MPAPEFFARLGLFVMPNFFDEALCADLVGAAQPSCWEPAWIAGTQTGPRLDEEVRKTLVAPMARRHWDAVNGRLEELRPALARHFGLPLSGFEEPQLLRYRPGCFFTPHRDDGHTGRQVSASIFLNDQTNGSGHGSYSGGSLVFYSLVGGPRTAHFGFPVVGQRGMVIAFRSDVLHEVEKVTAGERYSVVSWFY